MSALIDNLKSELGFVNPLDRRPTRSELEIAWATLRTARVTEIAGISLGELGAIVAGAPNYSDAEKNLARGLLVCRAALGPVGAEDTRALMQAIRNEEAELADLIDRAREVLDPLDTQCLRIARELLGTWEAKLAGGAS